MKPYYYVLKRNSNKKLMLTQNIKVSKIKMIRMLATLKFKILKKYLPKLIFTSKKKLKKYPNCYTF